MVVPPPFVPKPLLVRAAKTTFASERRSVDKANTATDDRDGMKMMMMSQKNAEFFGGEIDRSIFFPHCILYQSAYTKHVNAREAHAKTDKQRERERERERERDAPAGARRDARRGRLWSAAIVVANTSL